MRLYRIVVNGPHLVLDLRGPQMVLTQFMAKQYVVKLRVSGKEKRIIAAAAKQADRSVSSWLRFLALAASNGLSKELR